MTALDPWRSKTVVSTSAGHPGAQGKPHPPVRVPLADQHLAVVRNNSASSWNGGKGKEGREGRCKIMGGGTGEEEEGNVGVDRKETGPARVFSKREGGRGEGDEGNEPRKMRGMYRTGPQKGPGTKGWKR